MEENIMNEVVIREEGMPLVARGKTLARIIVDDESAANAKKFKDTINSFRKGAKAYWDSMEAPAKATLKEIKAKADAQIKPLDEVYKILGDALGQYEYKQRIAAIEEQKKQNAALEQMKKDNPAVAAMLPTSAPLVKRQAVAVAVERWHAEVKDKMALIKAVADGKVAPECLDVHLPFFNQMATLKKVEGELVPGVVALKDISSR